MAVRNLGPGDLDQLVPYRLTSDTGLSGGGNTAVSGQGVTGMQVDLRQNDYGRRHRFTVVLDPLEQLPELDEGDNVLRVDVTLPSAVTDTVDVPCTVP